MRGSPINEIILTARHHNPESGTSKLQTRISKEEGLIRIYRYCAYQERSHQEVKDKLFDFGLRSSEVDELMARLITEGFLNEERFAKAFSGGKFRIKKWGRIKIKRQLEQRGLTANCIARGMKEIDDADYRKTLGQVIQKKAKLSSEINPFKKRNKIALYAIARGYEPELVWDMVKDLLPM